jgi:nucleoid-associated protein YgaU
VSDDTPPPTAGAVAGDRFPPHSRYSTSEVVTVVGADGVERRFLRRRFVPPQDDLSTVAEHLVTAEDRLDLLAQLYYGDPLLAWRIADANGADDPADLVRVPGRVLRIPAPDSTIGFGGA